MEEKFIESLASSGVIGIVAVIAIYAIKKLYADMKSEHTRQLNLSLKREDKLMLFLDRKNESDARIVNTLDCINDKMDCMDKRIECIERKLPHDN